MGAATTKILPLAGEVSPQATEGEVGRRGITSPSGRCATTSPSGGRI
jgi:hypothetical protein